LYSAATATKAARRTAAAFIVSQPGQYAKGSRLLLTLRRAAMFVIES